MSLLALVFGGFVLALLAAALAPSLRRATAPLFAAGTGGLLWGLTSRFEPGAPPVQESVAWLGALGADIALRLDGLSFFFAVLILSVGAATLWYAGAYMREWKEGRGVFCALLLSFMASMLGLVLSDNLLVAYVFWEMTTVVSFLLIGFKRKEAGARDSAFVSLLVTGAGGLALLGGILLLGSHAGTFAISEIVSRGPVRDPQVANWATLLIGAGALIKCAQFPFHFWLPRAMTAPTPASAYLHAAAMVKAGLYLLARLLPALGQAEWWTPLLAGVSGLSMLVAIWGMLASSDFKAVLAYATIGALAVGVALLAIGTPQAMETFAVFLLAHAGYKACLFMVAGGVEESVGARDLRELGRLARLLPGLAFAAVGGALALAEIGPELSYIAKEAALEAFHKEGGWMAAALFAALASAFVAASAIVGYKPFFGKQGPPHREHRETVSLWAPAALLGWSGVAFALAPAWTQRWLAAPLVEATTGRSEELEKLALWHGWNWKVATTLATVAVGVALACLWPRLRPLLARGNRWTLEGVEWLARGGGRLWERAGGLQQNWIEHGRLPLYVLASALAVALATLPWTGETFGEFMEGWGSTDGLWLDVCLVALGAVGVVGAAVARDRWAMVASLAVVGLILGLVYARFGAPDVALANVLVETLMVALLVSAVRGLPDLRRLASKATSGAKLLVATACGGAVTLALVGSRASGVESRVSEHFIQKTAEKDGASNVVATILVDFRGLDTLGEITVLATAAIGVFHLARSAGRRRKGGEE